MGVVPLREEPASSLECRQTGFAAAWLRPNQCSGWAESPPLPRAPPIRAGCAVNIPPSLPLRQPAPICKASPSPYTRVAIQRRIFADAPPLSAGWANKHTTSPPTRACVVGPAGRGRGKVLEGAAAAAILAPRPAAGRPGAARGAAAGGGG